MATLEERQRIGKLIHDTRKKEKVTQVQLGQLIGVTKKAISDYELIKENDNIMVCISGGKDSFLLAKCIQELIKHGKFPFTAHYVLCTAPLVA